MTRDQALELLHKHMQNPNLRRHCYAVEAVMRALARELRTKNPELRTEKFDEEIWGIAGLLHDADYELTKENAKEHTHKTVSWLKELKADQKIIDAILAHGFGFVEGNPQPSDNMQWSLFCCDELTGLIVAVSLVKEKSINNVTVESVLKKFPKKDFAAGVHREQIQLCEEKLGIKLEEFIRISLGAMQGVSKELGL